MTRKILHKVALQICGAETDGIRLRNLEPRCPEKADLSRVTGEEDPKQHKSDFLFVSGLPVCLSFLKARVPVLSLLSVDYPRCMSPETYLSQSSIKNSWRRFNPRFRSMLENLPSTL